MHKITLFYKNRKISTCLSIFNILNILLVIIEYSVNLSFEMDRNGSKWIEMDRNGPKWTEMDQNRPEYIQQTKLSIEWLDFISNN